jgi:hypothetical protein
MNDSDYLKKFGNLDRVPAESFDNLEALTGLVEDIPHDDVTRFESQILKCLADMQKFVSDENRHALRRVIGCIHQRLTDRECELASAE